MSLYQLIYVSSAVEDLSDSELDRILESSVRHNSPQAVTGMLVYAKGNFMQVLEGEEAAIDETYERILKDERHRKVFLLAKEPILEREFPGWSMRFRRLTPSDATEHPAYAPMFARGFDAEQIGERPELAISMLRQFSRIHE